MGKIVNLQCSIWSPSGKLASLGDTLIVHLPEIDKSGPLGDGFWVSEKTIKAKLGLRLSRGLVLHVLEVIEQDEDDHQPKPGSVIQFKRTIWKWDVVEEIP